MRGINGVRVPVPTEDAEQMADYISRTDAIFRLRRRQMDDDETYHNIDYHKTWDDAISVVKHLPCLDVVEVVRCQECAHCDDKTPYELWCLGRGWPNRMVPPDGYCDKGKRREAAR